MLLLCPINIYTVKKYLVKVIENKYVKQKKTAPTSYKRCGLNANS